MDRATNLQILFLFCLLMVMAFLSSLGSYLWTSKLIDLLIQWMIPAIDGILIWGRKTAIERAS